MLNMRVLVACEFSGTIRDAFLKEGFDAVSCDLLPTESEGPHIQDDVLNHLDKNWDLIIACPPCTHLAISGAHLFKYKKKEQEEALEFVNKLLDTPHAKHVCIENPVSVISTRLRKPDQIIQPYQFGHPEKKKTCLWLKNLPKLESTEDVSHILESLPKRERERVLFMPQSKNRAKLRSVFYTGIAEAMAKQWGSYIRKQHNNESI